MVSEARVGQVVRSAGTLQEAGRALIAAANAAGGRDNITVVLFRLEDVEPAAGSAAAATSAVIDEDETAEYETFSGDAVTEPRQGVSRPEAHTRLRDEADGRRSPVRA